MSSPSPGEPPSRERERRRMQDSPPDGRDPEDAPAAPAQELTPLHVPQQPYQLPRPPKPAGRVLPTLPPIRPVAREPHSLLHVHPAAEHHAAAYPGPDIQVLSQGAPGSAVGLVSAARAAIWSAASTSHQHPFSYTQPQHPQPDTEHANAYPSRPSTAGALSSHALDHPLPSRPDSACVPSPLPPHLYSGLSFTSRAPPPTPALEGYLPHAHHHATPALGPPFICQATQTPGQASHYASAASTPSSGTYVPSHIFAPMLTSSAAPRLPLAFPAPHRLPSAHPASAFLDAADLSAARAELQPWADLVHSVTWDVARAFGFQAFNAQEQDRPADPNGAPSLPQQWSPATAFVAADHLVALVVHNGYLRTCRTEPHLPDEQSFARAVWHLHSHIFLPYEAQWCKMVGLPVRTRAAEEQVLRACTFDDPRVVRGLLSELALYFLLYTEAANLRHLAEGLFFFYWCAALSPTMEALWLEQAASWSSMRDGRQRRLEMRNGLADVIAATQAHFHHDPAASTPQACAAGLAEMCARLPPGQRLPASWRRSDAVAAGGPAAAGSAGGVAEDEDLLLDMCAYGDGGFFCDRVTSPVFTVLAFEVDHMYAAGQDVAFRIGYDDAAECLCSREIVSAALQCVGVSRGSTASADANAAFEGLTTLGCAPGHPFDPAAAAAVWADCIFVKTFRERRSWLALWRVFHRVYTLHFVLLHIIIVQSFAPNNVRLLSGAVVTHALCSALERYANWWLTRPRDDPLQRVQKRGSWTKAKTTAAAAGAAGPTSDAAASENASASTSGGVWRQGRRDSMNGKVKARAGAGAAGADSLDPEAAAAAAAASGGSSTHRLGRARRLSDGQAVAERLARRKRFRVEGAPLWGTFGFIEWLLAGFGITGLYVMQFMGPMQAMARAYWLFAAGGYVAAFMLHSLVTWRDGYVVSLSSMLRLPQLFRASSTRAVPQYWVHNATATGWRATLLTLLFWLQVLALKIAFDYWVIMAPMAPQLRLIMTRNWLGCGNRKYNIMGTKLPLRCIDGDWFLALVRMLPFLLVCLVDTQIFYQITLMIWGVIRGMMHLDLGVVGDWDGLRAEFHRAPRRWWASCMSSRGRESFKSQRPGLRTGLGLGSDSAGGALSRRSNPTDTINCETSSCGSRNSGTYISLEYGTARGLARSQSMAVTSEEGASASGGSASPRSTKSNGSHLTARSSATSRKERRRDLQEMLMGGTGDEHVAMWDAWSWAWDEVVEDLRESDLISDAERANLAFTRLALPDRPPARTVAALFAAPGDADGAAVAPASVSVRPLLLPAFFYAGQLQRILDTGSATQSQRLVAQELRQLLVWAAAQLGLVTAGQAQALLQAPFTEHVLDLNHSCARERGARAAGALLRCLREVQAAPAGLEDLRRRLACHAEAVAALGEVLTSLEVEARAVIKQGGRDAAQAKAARSRRSRAKKFTDETGEGAAQTDVDVAEAVLLTVAEMRRTLVDKPAATAAALSQLHAVPYAAEQEAAHVAAADGVGGAALPALPAVELSALNLVLSTASKMLGLSAAATQPAGAEAQRVLGFFMSSLANPQLGEGALPVDEMPSWSVLTPCYEEDVLYPLDASSVAEAVGLAAPKAKAGKGKGMADLTTETEDSVSLMAYLRSLFPKEFNNFLERTCVSADASEADFAIGGRFADQAVALQLWASYRGQLLARTVRGMACYERALRVLARLECPRGPDTPRRVYDARLAALIDSKFEHVVASQMYGKNRRSEDLRARWLAESTDLLLEAFPALKVAFLDQANTGPMGQQASYSVLVRGRRSGRWPASDRASRTEELYRVRLPSNPYSGRGVILGEGKPENQNHAAIFCFGEALQTIDMNQDNALAEGLKMRNLLSELKPEPITRRAQAAAKGLQELAASGSSAPAADYKARLAAARATESPVALVGFREYVFSDKAGALGSFAASSEFAFSTIVQRTQAWPAHVRFHYGHPDVWNKVFAMTRGGVSKATRQLHISEDLFGGMAASLRGGRVKFTEYISAGKGRDMGFDSINAFEAKISSGFGEVVLSREAWRLASRMDLWRLLHFYHSNAGHFINTYFMMGSVYAHIFALALFALAGASSFTELTYYPSPPPPPPGTPLTPTVRGAPPPPIGVVRETQIFNTIRIEHVLQLGLLSLLPYIVEVALEYGMIRAAMTALLQLVTGAFTFFIFKQQTTAAAFHDSVTYGGARYIATGRGFSISSSSFIKLFANYGRTHLHLGFELAFMAVVLAIANDCVECSYAGLTWGTWLVAVSLIMAPFWFNPLTFSTAKVQRDLRAWSAWLGGEVDPELHLTWHAWNKQQLDKARDERGSQDARWSNVGLSLLLSAAPPAVLALAAVSRLNLAITSAALPAPLGSSYSLFLIATALIWGLLAATLAVARSFHHHSDRRGWRIYTFWATTAAIALVVVYLAILSLWYDGNGFVNLCLIAYANVQLLVATHRSMAQICRRSPKLRGVVDSGYLLLDKLVGYTILALLGLLSLVGIVSRIQTMLLFNVTFAKSVRRGGLVRTIGQAKAQPGGGNGGAALAGLVLDQQDAASTRFSASSIGRGAHGSAASTGRGQFARKVQMIKEELR